MEMDEAEIAFLGRMRELAKRGAAATKKRVASLPDYYRALGRRGGQASSAARRAKRPRQIDAAATSEPPPVGSPSQTPRSAEQPPLSPYKKLLAERVRPSLNATPTRNRWDDFAEEQAARLIAQVRRQNCRKLGRTLR